MAKITYSSLITNISGSLAGSTFKRVKGASIIRNRQHTRTPNTAQQHTIKGHMIKLSVSWSDLTTTQQKLWDTFAALHPKSMSGFNAYVMLNLRLLASGYSSFVEQTAPPPTPVTPTAPEDATRSYISPTKNRISWTAPTGYTSCVQLYYAVEVGYSFKNKEKWQLVETVVAQTGQIDHDHDFPSGTELVYYLRTIDTYGRVSPRTERLK